MFSVLFDSSAYGWACSIGGSLFILFLGWLTKNQPQAGTEKKLDDALLCKFDELSAAIETEKVGESVFVAWMNEIPQQYNRNRSPKDMTPFLQIRMKLRGVMRHRGWSEASITQFDNTFFRIATENLTQLLPDQR